MPFRVTDSANTARFSSQVARGQQRVQAAQERLASNSRINRPSDDPDGAASVLRLRTAQAMIDVFKRNVGAAEDSLAATDAALDSYETILERARALLTQGASGTANAEARATVAAELDGLRERALALANTRHGDSYLFGGTRQDAPPFDSTGAPDPRPASARLVQFERGAAPVNVGVTAETVFADSSGTIFDALASASAALRGTGDPAADEAATSAAMERVSALGGVARVARTSVGVRLAQAESTRERLTNDFIALETVIQRTETVDMAEAAIALSEASRALEATLQTGSFLKRPTLIDIIG